MPQYLSPNIYSSTRTPSLLLGCMSNVSISTSNESCLSIYSSPSLPNLARLVGKWLEIAILVFIFVFPSYRLSRDRAECDLEQYWRSSHLRVGRGSMWLRAVILLGRGCNAQNSRLKRIMRRPSDRTHPSFSAGTASILTNVVLFWQTTLYFLVLVLHV